MAKVIIGSGYYGSKNYKRFWIDGTTDEVAAKILSRFKATDRRPVAQKAPKSAKGLGKAAAKKIAQPVTPPAAEAQAEPVLKGSFGTGKAA